MSYQMLATINWHINLVLNFVISYRKFTTVHHTLCGIYYTLRDYKWYSW